MQKFRWFLVLVLLIAAVPAILRSRQTAHRRLIPMMTADGAPQVERNGAAATATRRYVLRSPRSLETSSAAIDWFVWRF